MFCSERSLVKHSSAGVSLSVLWCNSWGCEHCGGRRAWKCARDMERGIPHKFLTLTVNPAVGVSQEHRARRLLAAWRKWVQVQRKAWGKLAVEYYYVFEAQKSGEPHLHIVGRWPRIEKEDISAWFAKEIQAPSTRIEGIRSAKNLCQYLTQYLTKGPTKFGTLKRYGYSRKYFIKAKAKMEISKQWQGAWEIVETSWHDLFNLYWFKGYRRLATARVGYSELLRPVVPPPRAWPAQRAGLHPLEDDGLCP